MSWLEAVQWIAHLDRNYIKVTYLVHQWSVLTRSELNMETRISSRMGISWKIAEKLVELSY